MSKEFIVDSESESGGETQFSVGDAEDALQDAPTLQTIVTDPPYNLGHDYGPVSDSRSFDDYKLLIERVLDASFDALSDDGSLFFIHYPDMVARLYDVLTKRFNVHQHLTWVYPTNFGHSSKRFTKAHRSVVWLSKDDPKFYPKRVVQPYKNPDDPRIKRLKEEKGRKGPHLYSWWEIDLCKNVSSEKREYANQLPERLVEIPILCTSDEGDWVGDPFAGTFTVPRVALRHGRNAWGADKNPDTKQFWPK